MNDISIEEPQFTEGIHIYYGIKGTSSFQNTNLVHLTIPQKVGNVYGLSFY